MWLRDTGVLNRLMYDIFPSLNVVPAPVLRSNLPLTIQQLGITMILLIVGIALSIITFFMELFMQKGKKNVLPSNTLELRETDAIRRISNSEVAVFTSSGDPPGARWLVNHR